MAWLKGLAGKAEDFLNQIDQNAAVALSQKEKQALVDNQLTEVTWDGQHQQPQPKMSTDAPIASDSYSNTSTPQSSRSNTALNSIRSSPNLSSFMPIRSASKPKKDEELISFLNSSTPNYKTKAIEQIQKPVATREELNISSSVPAFEGLSKRSSPMHVEIVTDGDMTLSTYSDAGTSRSSSRRDTPVKELSEKLPTQIQMNKEAEELRTENGLLKSELQSFNNEMLLLLQRAKTAEKGCTSLQQQLTKLQASKTQICLTLKDKEDQAARLEIELKLARQELNTAIQLSKNVKIENSRLIQESAKSTGYESEALLACRQQLASKEEEFERARSVHQQEIVSIKGTIKSFESEKESLTSQIAEARQVLNDCRSESKEWQDKFEKSRLEIAEARSEFDQYKTRAQRILHDKDKLIAELRGDGVGRGGSPIDDVTAMELEQLRQERELVREEAMQVATRLKATRAELAEAEKRLEANREQAIESHARLHSSLMEEQSRRQAAEEDCRTQAEGLRSVREELSRQRSLLASKVRERETELTRLRTQLSQRPASPVGDEMESRLHALTRTLVLKQTALETVTTERNALRLQYEKLECKQREAIARLYHAPGGVGGSVNDTDDAKARVPSFLEESPFDTSVARRVKRAYSNLDGVSIRTGVFLRRYPLARILMLCYMVLLHLWVMIVLFTYTPEIHAKPT